MSISRVMDKEDVLHIHNGISLSCFLILKYYKLICRIDDQLCLVGGAITVLALVSESS